jgi:hypothetical protein
MLLRKARWIYFYDVVLEPHPNDAPYTELRELMPGLEKRFKSGDCVKLINNETAAIRIIDLSIAPGKDLLSLLIQYCDQNAADPVFANLETGELRVEPKLKGEGIAVSAHFSVSLKPRQKASHSYLAVLESVPGINRGKIEAFLTSEFKEICNTYRYTSRDGKVKKYRPIPSLVGYAAQSLKDEFERGELLGIELIKYTNQSGGLDEPGYVKEESEIIRLKVLKKASGEDAIGLLNRIKTKAHKKGFGEMRIKYKRQEGKQISVPADTSRLDVGNMLYTKCEYVILEDDLPQCIRAFDKGLLKTLYQLVVKARNTGNYK